MKMKTFNFNNLDLVSLTNEELELTTGGASKAAVAKGILGLIDGTRGSAKARAKAISSFGGTTVNEDGTLNPFDPLPPATI